MSKNNKEKERELVKQKIGDIITANFDKGTASNLVDYFNNLIDKANDFDLNYQKNSKEIIEKYDKTLIEIGMNMHKENPETILYFVVVELFSVIRSYLTLSVERAGLAGLSIPPSIELCGYLIAFLKIITLLEKENLLDQSVFDELSNDKKMETLFKMQDTLIEQKNSQKDSPKGVDPDWYNKLKEVPPEWGKIVKD